MAAPAAATMAPSPASSRRTRRGVEARGQQQADFAGPLLDAEPEEQGGEHDGRGHEEEAESQEQAVEGRRARRGGEGLTFDGHERHAHCGGVELFADGGGHRVGGSSRRPSAGAAR